MSDEGPILQIPGTALEDEGPILQIPGTVVERTLPGYSRVKVHMKVPDVALQKEILREVEKASKSDSGVQSLFDVAKSIFPKIFIAMEGPLVAGADRFEFSTNGAGHLTEECHGMIGPIMDELWELANKSTMLNRGLRKNS